MKFRITNKMPVDYTLVENEEVVSILQDIALLLQTKKGTVPGYRDFGLPMRFLDRPLPAARALMFNEIKEAIEKYEPRAELVNIAYTVDETDPGKLIPTVEVNIRDEQS